MSDKSQQHTVVDELGNAKHLPSYSQATKYVAYFCRLQIGHKIFKSK